MAALLQTLFTFDFYKRTQGKLVRQVTFASLAIIVLLGCWALKQSLIEEEKALQFGLPLALLAAGIWTSFRIAHFPPFADFLISVEAEMNKVSWPRRGELYRASLVVMLVIFVMAGLLFGYDLALQAVPKVWAWLAGKIAGGMA